MLIKDLIKELQDIYDKEVVHRDIMGEPEIMIDKFEPLIINSPCTGEKFVYNYLGITPKISIEQTPDGVYYILSQGSE